MKTKLLFAIALIGIFLCFSFQNANNIIDIVKHTGDTIHCTTCKVGVGFASTIEDVTIKDGKSKTKVNMKEVDRVFYDNKWYVYNIEDGCCGVIMMENNKCIFSVIERTGSGTGSMSSLAFYLLDKTNKNKLISLHDQSRATVDAIAKHFAGEQCPKFDFYIKDLLKTNTKNRFQNGTFLELFTAHNEKCK